MNAWLLGSGSWLPTGRRETTSVLVRREGDALVLDAGTGLRRLVTDSARLDGVAHIDVVLTHFHLDHVCGLAYLPALSQSPRIWAPGRWLYGRPSAELLAPLREPPISPFDAAELGEIVELSAGPQRIEAFEVRAREQRRHWAPTAGLRVGDELALVTDTAFDPGSVPLARGIANLLHEAWSSSTAPRSAEGDATGAEAGRVAAGAEAHRLTLVHLNPLLEDHEPVLADARSEAPQAELGEDGQRLLP